MTVALALVGACASADKGGAPPTPTKEVAAGGARIRGGGVRMDVQLGRAQPKKPIKNGAVTIKPNATVTP
jgi:hypothetical protein